MKKIVTVLALAIALSSCSNDDDNNQEEFFNLKVGNQWVYKKYNGNETQVTFSGAIDTVRVVGTEILDGKEYFRLTHTNWIGDDVEFLRVAENGHLISSEGFVQHPGTDKDYEESRDILQGNGVVKYTLKDMTSITIENMSYNVYPFSGYYTPNPGQGGTEGIGVIESYSKGIGFIVRHYKYLAGTAYFEYRLVSYDLK